MLYGFATQFLDAFVYFASVGVQKSVVLTSDELRFLRLLATKDDPEVAKEAEYMFGSAITLQRSIARKLGSNLYFKQSLYA